MQNCASSLTSVGDITNVPLGQPAALVVCCSTIYEQGKPLGLVNLQRYPLLLQPRSTIRRQHLRSRRIIKAYFFGRTYILPAAIGAFAKAGLGNGHLPGAYQGGLIVHTNSSLIVTYQVSVRSPLLTGNSLGAALWAGEPDAAEQWLRQSLATSGAPAWVTLDEVQRLWVAARLATAQQPAFAEAFATGQQMELTAAFTTQLG